MLKLVDYTATPEQSAKAASSAWHHQQYPLHPQSLQATPLLVCFAESLMVIDYRTVLQVHTITDAPTFYPEKD